MAVTIHNKTKRTVMIRLNSGYTCYLAAQASTGEIIDGEIRHNEKLARLQSRDIIEVREVKKPAAGAAKPKKARKKTTQKQDS